MDIHDVMNAVLQGSLAGNQAHPATTRQTAWAGSHQKHAGSVSQQAPAQPNVAVGDILGSILGGVFGNHAQPAQSQAIPPRVPSPGGGMGGQPMPSTSSAGTGINWGDILGTMMGAGLGSVAANTVLAPIITQLAQRFNIPPRIAQMVVAFAIAQLVQGHMQGGSVRTNKGAYQVTDLVDNMCGPNGCSDSYLNQTGLPHELADRTGLDPATSAKALQYAFNALGHQVSG